jgi:hypothetical protein
MGCCRLELIRTPIEEVAQRGRGENLGGHVEPGRDGGELLLLLGSEVDREAHLRNLARRAERAKTCRTGEKRIRARQTECLDELCGRHQMRMAL